MQKALLFIINHMSKSGRNAVSTKNALNQINTHEKECAIRYQNIEKRLEEGSKRFDRLETMLWAVYPFIVGTVILARFI